MLDVLMAVIQDARQRIENAEPTASLVKATAGSDNNGG